MGNADYTTPAIKKQLDELAFCTRRYTNRTAVNLARKLSEIAPHDLNKSLFCPGGAEAVGMAVKLARYGIRVNAIAPGPFDTNMMDYMRQDPGRLARFHAAIPAQRSGGEDDIKGAVVFLASEASRYVTGHTLIVDGGMHPH